MPRYVALLRAVNVGGTGKLAMADLRAICREAGFSRVETYIASGNVVFESGHAPDGVKSDLEARLFRHAGRPIGVMVRTAREIAGVRDANPFPDAEPHLTYAVFLDAPPPLDTLEQVSGRSGEDMRLGLREIFIRYSEGMGRSKLRVPAAAAGTARNMNTVARLAEMAAAP